MNAPQHTDSDGHLHTCKFKVGQWVGREFANNVAKPGKIVEINWDDERGWVLGVQFRIDGEPRVLHFESGVYRIKWSKRGGRSVWEWA